MPDYVILTDSSADLTAEMVREAGVTVLPLSFTIQGETYQNTPDNREMDPALFYDMLRAGELATTSAELQVVDSPEENARISTSFPAWSKGSTASVYSATLMAEVVASSPARSIS